ncbi:hypothetical protein [Lysinibacillus fusiformis]|uniref:hypothetical protein n=1 Tax=Lysinibacillus fusiformis TaxID=28031 RepID=UPI003D02D026
MDPITVNETAAEVVKLFTKVGVPFFLIFTLLLIVPTMVKTMANLMGAGGSRRYSDPEPIFKPNFKKVTIKTKQENMITYGFLIKSMEKQSFIKSLFSSSTMKIGKKMYKKGYKTYEFTTNQDIYIKICNDIHKPLAEIKDETLLIQFDEAIHYALKQLEQFAKQRGIVDLQQEVDRVIQLVKEIKTFTDYVDNEAQAETEKLRVSSMNEILSKHHTVMEQLTLGVKVFNTSNQTVINQEKNKQSISLDKPRNKVTNDYYAAATLDNNYYDSDRDSYSYNGHSHSSHSSDSHSYSHSDSSSSSDSSSFSSD